MKTRLISIIALAIGVSAYAGGPGTSSEAFLAEYRAHREAAREYTILLNTEVAAMDKLVEGYFGSLESTPLTVSLTAPTVDTLDNPTTVEDVIKAAGADGRLYGGVPEEPTHDGVYAGSMEEIGADENASNVVSTIEDMRLNSSEWRNRPAPTQKPKFNLQEYMRRKRNELRQEQLGSGVKLEHLGEYEQ